MTIGIITQMRRKIQHELQRMKKVKACHDFGSFCKRMRQSDDQRQGQLVREAIVYQNGCLFTHCVNGP